MGNWNICNAILITSSSLPIQPEYYPIHTSDGASVQCFSWWQPLRAPAVSYKNVPNCKFAVKFFTK